MRRERHPPGRGNSRSRTGRRTPSSASQRRTLSNRSGRWYATPVLRHSIPWPMASSRTRSQASSRSDRLWITGIFARAASARTSPTFCSSTKSSSRTAGAKYRRSHSRPRPRMPSRTLRRIFDFRFRTFSYVPPQRRAAQKASLTASIVVPSIRWMPYRSRTAMSRARAYPVLRAAVQNGSIVRQRSRSGRSGSVTSVSCSRGRPADTRSQFM